MPSEPLVDVIIPTRNRFALTMVAICSVRAQEFEDWRLTVVDDASDDASTELLGAEIEADSRITLIERSTPGGAQAARQAGLEHPLKLVRILTALSVRAVLDGPGRGRRLKLLGTAVADGARGRLGRRVGLP